MNKGEMIDEIAVKVDALVDMRGTEKCRTALEIINMLATLKNAVNADAAAEEQRMREMQEKIKRQEQDEDAETVDGKTYQYGVVGGGSNG